MALLSYVVLQFKKWKNNICVILSFILLLILCMTVTKEYIEYAESMEFTIGVFEPFILMFTQKYALISITLIFLLLFHDVPFLDSNTPYALIRGKRAIWVLGQLLYIFLSVIIFITFALTACICIGFRFAYLGNIWSETAWFTANGGALNQSSPIPLILIQKTTQFYSVLWIYILTILSVTVITFVLFIFNLWKGKYYGLGAVAVLIFSGYITILEKLKESGLWFSVIGHANLAYHSFDKGGQTPTVMHSVILMLAIIAVCCIGAWYISKEYVFFREVK